MGPLSVQRMTHQRVLQVTEVGMGIAAWADKCMAVAEDMLKEMVDALLDHDAAILRADLPGLHAACLSVLRQTSHLLAAGQPAASAPQVVSIKRMEQRVEQLQKELTSKQEAEKTLRTSVENLQKENSALQQVNGRPIPWRGPPLLCV